MPPKEASCRMSVTRNSFVAGHSPANRVWSTASLPHGVREIFSKFRKIVVCELNEGQFANYLRQNFQEFHYEQYNKCEGQPFTVVELKQKFESLLK